MRSPSHLLVDLPEAPGVYLLFGAQDELLYIGKSKSVRSRVRAHFNDRSERRMMRRVARVETRLTAGELGALLLESRLIKELRPLYNVMSRQRRRVIVARRRLNAGGYVVVSLEPTDYLAIRPDEPILGLFKHTTQAKEFLARIARERRLCHKLLHLEQARSYCFGYHLGHCDGACMGEEPADTYNARLESAFEERRIKAWPYEGALVVEEHAVTGDRTERFIIDNGCLLGSLCSDGTTWTAATHRFDYDSYKILHAYVTDERNRGMISIVARDSVAT